MQPSAVRTITKACSSGGHKFALMIYFKGVESNEKVKTILISSYAGACRMYRALGIERVMIFSEI